MSEFKKYKQKPLVATIEARDITQQELDSIADNDMLIIDGVTVMSIALIMENPPKLGDKIIRLGSEDNSKMFISKEDFERRYEPENTFFDRLVVEKSELSQKIGKLYAFLKDGPEVSPIQKTLLIIQHRIMVAYEEVLDARIKHLIVNHGQLEGEEKEE